MSYLGWKKLKSPLWNFRIAAKQTTSNRWCFHFSSNFFLDIYELNKPLNKTSKIKRKQNQKLPFRWLQSQACRWVSTQGVELGPCAVARLHRKVSSWLLRNRSPHRSGSCYWRSCRWRSDRIWFDLYPSSKNGGLVLKWTKC